MDTQQALDVLKQGMSTELWGQRFYEQAAKRTAAEDGKKVFKSLVAEEGKHLDILRGEYAALSGSADWLSVKAAMAMASSVNPMDIFPQASKAKELIPAGATDVQALDMAMDFERRGFELYSTQAKAVTSAGAKAMWDFLAKAEDAHYAFLAGTREYLVTNGAWYFDAQEFPFFEG